MKNDLSIKQSLINLTSLINKKKTFSKTPWKNSLKFSFTLVELIVVIAIIAILTVWALMVLTKWLWKSRDSRRMADLETLQKWLTTYYTDVNWWNWKYPECDSTNWTCVDIISWWVVYWKQWEITETIAGAASISKEIKDPDGSYYTYIVTNSRKKFQIMTMLESWKE